MKENMLRETIPNSFCLSLPYKCPKCSNSRRFSTFSELRIHLEYEHSSLLSERKVPKIPVTYPTFQDKLDLLCFQAEHFEKQLETAKERELQNKYLYRKMQLDASPNKKLNLSKLKIQNESEISYTNRDLLTIVEKLKFELNIKQTQLEKSLEEMQTLASEKFVLLQKIQDLSLQLDNNMDHLAEIKAQLEEKEKEIEQLTNFLQEASQKETTARLELERFINDLLIRADKAESEVSMMRSIASASSVCGKCLSSQNSISKLCGSSQGFQEQNFSPRTNSIQEQIMVAPQSTSTIHLTHRSTPKYHNITPEREDEKFFHPSPNFSHMSQGKPPVVPGDSFNTGRKHFVPSINVLTHSESYQPPSQGDDSYYSHQSSQLPLDDDGILWDCHTPQRSQSSPLMFHTKSKGSSHLHLDRMTSINNHGVFKQKLYKEPRFIKEFSKNSALPKKLKENQFLFSKNLSHENKIEGGNYLEESYLWKSHQEIDGQQILFHIFKFLDVRDLLRCAQVCKIWREIAHHSCFWQQITFAKCCIYSKVLQNISRWSNQLTHLSLKGLKPIERKSDKHAKHYKNNARDSLEVGLEELLLASSKSLVSLSIIDCDSVLTDRSLWLSSCYNRHLKEVVYISQSYPISSEVLWSLGAGCKEITKLIIPPLYPNPKQNRFSDHCLSTLCQCWPAIKILCIGGTAITGKGLINLASRCQNLRVLELDYLQEVTEKTAFKMCRQGLRKLQVLVFAFTPVKANTLIVFKNGCPQLMSMEVNVRISNFFHDHNFHNIESFKKIASKLLSLKKNPWFSENLVLKVDDGDNI